jgi:Fic family protein
VPVIAGLVHYQFVTRMFLIRRMFFIRIHPFYDGNGRTARALATLILSDVSYPHRHGYDLGRFYNLEEVYVQNLPAYYGALQTHPHHNYYEGRADADLTVWLDYFVHSMAVVFRRVADKVRAQVDRPAVPEPPELRRLDRRARPVLGLFARQETVTTAEIARALGLASRTVRDLVKGRLADGWPKIADPARKSRRYRSDVFYPLSADYRQFIGEITAGGQDGILSNKFGGVQ